MAQQLEIYYAYNEGGIIKGNPYRFYSPDIARPLLHPPEWFGTTIVKPSIFAFLSFLQYTEYYENDLKFHKEGFTSCAIPDGFALIAFNAPKTPSIQICDQENFVGGLKNRIHTKLTKGHSKNEVHLYGGRMPFHLSFKTELQDAHEVMINSGGILVQQ